MTPSDINMTSEADQFRPSLRLDDDDFVVVKRDSELHCPSPSSASSLAGPMTPQTYCSPAELCTPLPHANQHSRHHNQMSGGGGGAFTPGYPHSPVSFELTPPASAVASYFHLGDQYPPPECHFGHGLVPSSAPVTPTRPQAHLPELGASNALDLVGGRPASNTLDMGGCYHGPLGDIAAGDLNARSPSTIVLFWGPSSPAPAPPASAAPCDLQMVHSAASPFGSDASGHSFWEQMPTPASSFDGSPDYLFVQHDGSCSSQAASPLSPQPPRRRVVESRSARERSSMLHQVVTRGPRGARQPAPRRSHVVNGVEFAVDESPRYFCHLPNCSKAYKRQEHLKRHIAVNHHTIRLRCQFCGRNFNRMDNLIAHMERHTEQRDSRARIKFFPLAAAYLAEIKQSQKGSRGKRRARAAITQRLGSQ